MITTSGSTYGNYSNELPSGEVAVTNWLGAPLSPLITGNIDGAIPTNDWWSSLTFPHFGNEYSTPMYAHPLALQAGSGGLSLGYTPQAIFISNGSEQVKYEFTYHSDLNIGLENLNASATQLADYSDWAVTAAWADSDSSNVLEATFAHGSPFVYFERQGNADVTIELKQNTATAINQPNQTVETFTLENISGQYQGGGLQFNAQVNAGSNGTNAVGNAAQARISIDSNGDGTFDYIETYNFIPLDADPNNTESYQQSEGRGTGADTFGQPGDLNNATIKFEIWQAFGEGDVDIVTGGSSTLDLPYQDLTDQSGNALAAQLSLAQQDGDNVLTAMPEPDSNLVLGAQPETNTIDWEGPGSLWHLEDNVAGVTINGNHYALFAPTNSAWEINGDSLTSDLAGQDYFSAAVLPDNSLGTLNYFYEHAYAFIADTTAAYQYDQAGNQVATTFDITTELKEAGFSDVPLTTLYRHQWLNTDAALSDYSYNSPRGEMKLFEGNEFTTTYEFSGILPALPNLLDSHQTQTVYDAIEATYQDFTSREQVITAQDTYWVGKDLGKLAELTQIANQVGHIEARDYFLNTIKTELEDWFTVDAATEGDKQFYYNAEWGTLQGYPASFHSETQINDHHFHYGYFVKAAAAVAQYDPQWAQDWGGMVDLLVKDVANSDRSDSDYPYLRTFDPYAGHSWASGHGAFFAGNNHESSSEAMNFAVGTMSWGAHTGNQALIDLGTYLYATELAAINQYWFDVDNSVFPDQFSPDAVGMVWGDGAAHATWFSGEPEMIHGINFLPFTGGSLYLGQDPDYVQANYAEIIAENGGLPNQWQDTIWQYQALFDADSAIAQFSATPNYLEEGGGSYPHIYHWLYNLQVLGQVEAGVTADTLFYSVFNKDGLLTYSAYNPSAEALTVTFSDGAQIDLLAHEFKALNVNEGWSSINGALSDVDFEQPPVEDPPAEDPPAEDPPAEDPPAEDPPAEDPPAEDPPAEDPPAEDPPAEDPPAEDPPVEDPPVEDPPNNNVNTVTGTAAGEVLSGTQEDDLLIALAGNDQLHGHEGNDSLQAGEGNDYLHGNAGNDELDGGVGDDYLYGNIGDDRITGGLGKDFMVGGEGADIYVYTTLNDSTINQEDTIERFEVGSDKFDLSTLTIQFSDLLRTKEAGFTFVQANNSDFSIRIVHDYALAESDFIFGVSDNPEPPVEAPPVEDPPAEDPPAEDPPAEDPPAEDPPAEDPPAEDPPAEDPPAEDPPNDPGDNLNVINGTSSPEALHGTVADDQLNGLAGNDVLHGNLGDDELNAGDGSDYLHGNDGHDVLNGDSGNDYLHGNLGNDSLFGGDGYDFLYGNDGDDVLLGGLGKDFLMGGSGQDVYVYQSLSDSTLAELDIIENFVDGEDKIDLSALGIDADDVQIEQSGGVFNASVTNTDFAIQFVATSSLTLDSFVFVDNGSQVG